MCSDAYYIIHIINGSLYIQYIILMINRWHHPFLTLVLNSPWGRYRFTRLPFGINTAGDIFNEAIQELFGDLDGIQCVVDDILVHAPSVEEHDHRLQEVLKRACEVGLKLNKKKSKMRLTEVGYVGHTISHDGLKPSKEHIRAIVKMPTPQTKEEVQRFVAMIGYLQKFVPSLSDKTQLLH